MTLSQGIHLLWYNYQISIQILDYVGHVLTECNNVILRDTTSREKCLLFYRLMLPGNKLHIFICYQFGNDIVL
jgi:hypothetical protein